MKVLVTGGAGFIGRWVVKALLDRNCQVTVVDNLSRGREENLEEFCFHQNFTGLDVVDVGDRVALAESFSCNPDMCIHMASVVDVQGSIDCPEEAFHTDLRGTFHVLEECRRWGTRIVYVSTCMVYASSPDGEPISEDFPVSPLSPYAACKLSAEKLVESYRHSYAVPALVLRPFNVYGPFQRTGAEGSVVATFIERALHGEPLRIYGTGLQTRDFVYVEDCARFIVQAALEEHLSCRVLNAGSGKEISIRELARIVSDGRVGVTYARHPHPQCEIERMVCDCRRVESLLGWKAGTTLEAGIAKTAAWAGEHASLPNERTDRWVIAGSTRLIH